MNYWTTWPFCLPFLPRLHFTSSFPTLLPSTWCPSTDPLRGVQCFRSRPVLVSRRLKVLPATSFCLCSSVQAIAPAWTLQGLQIHSGHLHLLQCGVLQGCCAGIFSTMAIHGCRGQELLADFLQWLQRNFCSSAWNTSCLSFFSYLGVCSIVPLAFSSLIPLTAVQWLCPFLKIFSHLCHYPSQEAQLCGGGSLGVVWKWLSPTWGVPICFSQRAPLRPPYKQMLETLHKRFKANKNLYNIRAHE